MAESGIEARLRALFERQAAAEQPAAALDTELAHQRGRAQLRRRRAGTSAIALLVAAVAAIAITAGTRPAAGHRQPVAPGGLPAVAPRQFNPLIPYPSFGWLPAGTPLIAVETGRAEMALIAGKDPGHPAWELDVYSGGRCERRAGPAGQRGQVLHCWGSTQLRLSVPITGPAPPVHGHRAFMSSGSLVWPYARGGWAVLGGQNQKDLARIAAGVRYGQASTPGLFAAQLTGLPANWQISSVSYYPGGGSSLYRRVPRGGWLFEEAFDLDRRGADDYMGNAGQIKGFAYIDALPAPSSVSCDFHIRQSVIPLRGGGDEVVATTTDVLRRPVQELCAETGGMQADIFMPGAHPVPGVKRIFAHHLRLLGTSPAHWTRNPLG